MLINDGSNEVNNDSPQPGTMKQEGTQMSGSMSLPTSETNMLSYSTLYYPTPVTLMLEPGSSEWYV